MPSSFFFNRDFGRECNYLHLDRHLADNVIMGSAASRPAGHHKNLWNFFFVFQKNLCEKCVLFFKNFKPCPRTYSFMYSSAGLAAIPATTASDLHGKVILSHFSFTRPTSSDVKYQDRVSGRPKSASKSFINKLASRKFKFAKIFDWSM